MKVACLVSLAAVIVMIACGSDSPTPTAPSSQDGLPPGALSGPAAIDPGLPAGVVTVKASAPVPVSPADGTRVGSGTIDLTVTNPMPTYDVQWTFDVRFEVFENANPTVVVHSGLVTQGPSTTTYTVPAGVLPVDTFYVWRAHARRARAKAVPGRRSTASLWSRSTSLHPCRCSRLIVASSLRPAFTVQNGVVTGEVGTVLIEVEVALDSLFTDVSQVARTTSRDRGETLVPLSQNALANSCQEHGGTWEFMDRVVEALRAIDVSSKPLGV